MPHPTTLVTARAFAAVAVLALGATVVPAGAQDAAPPMHAVSILPPGNSQTYTAAGTAEGEGSGDPGAWGPWIDDQREMYWNYEMKDATFVESPADCGGSAVGARDRHEGVELPRNDVEVCWDAFGVPAVFGDTDAATWWGSGWVAAKLRLFLLEGAVRQARGTLAEIAGPGSLPADLERRTTRYSAAELTSFVEAQSPAAQEAFSSYVEGVNAYVDWVTTIGRDQLPAEYIALTTEPIHITVEDVAAVGIEMVRFVATEGRNEILQAGVLRDLEDSLGSDAGRDVFQDLFWSGDALAATTITAEEGIFPRLPDQTPAEREAAFQAMADFARTVPLELATGPGIEHNSAFDDPTLDSGNGDGTGDEPFITSPGASPQAPGGASSASAATAAFREHVAATLPARVDAMFKGFTRADEGASWMVMVAPSHSADGSTILMSEPQLDYDGGNFLMEVQLTGPNVNARGTTVAGIPVVGIGYTPDVAWALTTGNSKNIDTFIETTRPDSNGDGAPEYLHNGTWKDMSCRDEVFRYRGTVGPLPAGPPIQSRTETICRTIHGPVVSHLDDWSKAASWQYHLWGREVDTVGGVLRWNSATSLADIEASIPELTWNENIGAVDRFGRIGFWHPGTHLAKPAGIDLRLPVPGTGEFDNGEPLPPEALPHVVDPERGWIVNWNNKVAHGWEAGDATGADSWPAGIDQRVATLSDLVSERGRWSADNLIELDRTVSQTDLRTRHLLPLILSLRDAGDLTATERAALDVLAAWDRNALDGLDWPGFSSTTTANPATVGAAPTIFDEFVEQLDRDLFTEVTLASPGLVAQQYMGRHIVDTDTHLHLALRVLDPATSSLTPRRDYARGRTSEQILREVLAAAVTQLASVQGDDPTAWRGVYFDDGRGERGGKDGEVCTATGLVGPCGRHYYIERGAYIHHVAYPAAPVGSTPEPEPAPENPLPTTGGGLALAGLGVLAATTRRRRRRHERTHA